MKKMPRVANEDLEMFSKGIQRGQKGIKMDPVEGGGKKKTRSEKGISQNSPG